jgi:alpha-ketoglutarate-dependent 2,4-dichlorophenoxyacetate dioxygenase
MLNQYPELGGSQVDSQPFIDIGTTDSATGVRIDPKSRRGMMNAANALWHTDGSHSNPPMQYTILSARTLPTHPPDTEYADMRLAWDGLPDTRKAQLDGLMVEHNVLVSRARMGMKPEDVMSEETQNASPPAIHPLVRTDPISGRKSLYLASHASHIIGRPVAEGRKLIDELYEFATQPQYRYSHQWRPGDVLMWNDLTSMHRATEYNGSEPRILRWSGIIAQTQAA